MGMKAQSAMEYLMTYGWAILLIAIVMGAFYSLGIFSSHSLLPTACIGTSGFSCQNPVLSTSANTLTVSLSQFTGTNWKYVAFYLLPQNASTPSSCTSVASTPGIIAGSGPTYLSFGTNVAKVTFSNVLPPGSTIGTPYTGTIWAVYNTTGTGAYPTGCVEMAAISIKST